MCRTALIGIGIAIGALATFAAAHPAAAEYGAIAYDDSSGKRGVAWNYDTEKAAEEAATRDCGTGCNVVVRFGPKMCFAVATPDTGKGIGAASRPSVEAAKTVALADCKKHTSAECVVRDARCNR
jgi:hypothetical protein